MTGSTSAGRDLHKQLHDRPTADSIETPTRGTQGIAAGRALHAAKGRWANDSISTGDIGTDV